MAPPLSLHPIRKQLLLPSPEAQRGQVISWKARALPTFLANTPGFWVISGRARVFWQENGPWVSGDRVLIADAQVNLFLEGPPKHFWGADLAREANTSRQKKDMW